MVPVRYPKNNLTGALYLDKGPIRAESVTLLNTLDLLEKEMVF